MSGGRSTAERGVASLKRGADCQRPYCKLQAPPPDPHDHPPPALCHRHSHPKSSRLFINVVIGIKLLTKPNFVTTALINCP